MVPKELALGGNLDNAIVLDDYRILNEDGLRVVRLRGRFMQEACEATQGGMAAIIGLDEGPTREVCAAAGVVLADIVRNGSRRTGFGPARPCARRPRPPWPWFCRSPMGHKARPAPASRLGG